MISSFKSIANKSVADKKKQKRTSIPLFAEGNAEGNAEADARLWQRFRGGESNNHVAEAPRAVGLPSRVYPSNERKGDRGLKSSKGSRHYSSLYNKFGSLLMTSGERSKALNILSTALLTYRDTLLQEKGFTSNPQAKEFVLHRKELAVTKGVTKSERGMKGQRERKDLSLLEEEGRILLMQAINNIKPSLEVRKVRIAATTYTVPAVIQKGRQDTLAIRWLVEGAKKRRGRGRLSFSQSLAQELLDAYNKQGHALQKRDQLHALAESNRAYVRYRWW